jgi:hypothetical protein
MRGIAENDAVEGISAIYSSNSVKLYTSLDRSSCACYHLELVGL